jgi:hypothetical protein
LGAASLLQNAFSSKRFYFETLLLQNAFTLKNFSSIRHYFDHYCWSNGSPTNVITSTNTLPGFSYGEMALLATYPDLT